MAGEDRQLIKHRLPLLREHRIIVTVEGLLLLGQKQQDQRKDIICLLHLFTGDGRSPNVEMPTRFLLT
jgi:hypothetical protein